jgi:hypothetical protein
MSAKSRPKVTPKYYDVKTAGDPSSALTDMSLYQRTRAQQVAARRLEDQSVSVNGADLLVTFTIFRNVAPTLDDLTEFADYAWSDLVATIADVATYPEKAACPLISLAEYGDRLSDAGCARHGDNVKRVFGVELDYDAGQMPMAEAARLLQAKHIETVLHTTPSHKPAAPRWRVLAPLGDPYTPDRRREFVGRLNAVLGGVAAKESFTLSQSFYLGRVDGVEYEVLTTHGRTIDVCPDIEPLYYTGRNGDKPGAEPTDDELRARFKRGTGRYQAMLKLSSRWAARGMPAKDIAAELNALLDQCPNGTANDDGVDLRSRVDSMARTAVERFGRRTDDDAEWPEPVNFLRELAAPAFEAGDVPRELGPFAAAYARQTGIDPSITIPTAVVCAATALNDGFAIVADHASAWMQSPRVWLNLIAPSGAGKSPAVRTMLRSLHDIQRELAERYERDCAALGPNDDKPPRPRLVIADTTIEALSEVLRNNPAGVLVATDEFEAFLGSLDQYRKGAASRDRGEWLRLFDGGPHTVERIQRGSVYVENYGASLLTSTTPTALAKVARLLPEDGLLQRFLVVAGRRQIDGEPVPNLEQLRNDFEALLRKLHRLAPRVEKGYVAMTPAAKDAFATWRRKLRVQQEAADSIDPALGAHLAKYPTFALRLALTFHALNIVGRDDTDDDLARWPVQPETMARAFVFLERCRKHAMAVYLTLRGGSEAFDLARELARAIVALGTPRIERRDLLRHSWGFRKAEPGMQAQALDLLVDLGWLRPSGDGYRKSEPTRFMVNPLVPERFEKLAANERTRRAAVRELLQEISHAP